MDRTADGAYLRGSQIGNNQSINAPAPLKPSKKQQINNNKRYKLLTLVKKRKNIFCVAIHNLKKTTRSNTPPPPKKKQKTNIKHINKMKNTCLKKGLAKNKRKMKEGKGRNKKKQLQTYRTWKIQVKMKNIKLQKIRQTTQKGVMNNFWGKRGKPSEIAGKWHFWAS